MLRLAIRPALLASAIAFSALALTAPGAANAEAAPERAQRPAAEFRLPDDTTHRYSIGRRYYRGFAITPVSQSGITCNLQRGDFSAEVECLRAEHLIDLAYNQEALARRREISDERR